MVTTLRAPGVSVGVEGQGVYAASFPTNRTLVVLATRSNKLQPTGDALAAGTEEAGILRTVTSQREVLQQLGDPTFVTSAGVPVHGDETNEYGLWTLWSLLKGTAVGYYLRADIDLGQLVSSSAEPTNPPPDGTYWIDSDAVVGGIFRRNNANTAWAAVNFSVMTSSPSGGSAGDWAFDYSTTDGVISFKADDNVWYELGGADLSSTAIGGHTATNNTLWISDSAPTGAGANDFWWKTSSASGGLNLKLTKFRASDETWQTPTIVRSSTEPSSDSDVLWEDITTIQSDGVRTLKEWDGESAWVAITPLSVQAAAPTSAPVAGQLWFSDDISTFAMYKESSNVWVAITTTTSNSPSATQKVISASAPTNPSTNAIWVDISGANADVYPVVKRWNGASWEDISSSISITDTYTAASAVPNGTYWINTGDPSTKNTVKVWDPDYEPTIIDGGTPAAFDEEVNRRWKPYTGTKFGRRSQRYAVTRALQAVVADNDDIRSDAYYFQQIACPGYPELYDDLVALNVENGETALVVSDVPARMRVSGTPTGIEITATEWKTNANLAQTTGEDGFTSSGSADACVHYPWGLGTNTDGNNVLVPGSAVFLRTLAYSDSVSYPWFAPIGEERGGVFNVGSVGYLGDDGDFHTVKLTQGQAEVLYDLSINPIRFYNDIGLRVMGQKTLLGTSALLSRINVARLVEKLRYELRLSLRAFIGYPNDPITWASAKNLVDRKMAGIKALRGVFDWATRCDENINTADRIAANELWIELAIKPIPAVEFIYVPIKVATPGESLTGGN